MSVRVSKWVGQIVGLGQIDCGMVKYRRRRLAKKILVPLVTVLLLWSVFVLVPAHVPQGNWFRNAFFALFAWGVLVETRRLQLTRLELVFPGLADALDGLRIVQLSDLHLRTFGLNRYDFRRAARLAQSVNPDLIVITGDIVARNVWSDWGIHEALPLSAPLGIIATFGNSDQRHRVALADELRAAGIRLLVNEHCELNRNGARVLVVGVDDPVSNRDDARAAFASAPQNPEVLLFLTHAELRLPDELDAYAGPRVILAGHTHGGQFRLPFALRRPDRQTGHRVLANGAHIHINRGIGHVMPLRMFCPPEVTLITLRRRA